MLLDGIDIGANSGKVICCGKAGITWPWSKFIKNILANLMNLKILCL
jgi:hypothetical protein